ncbi:MAG TPA: phosphoribosyltransferase family protein [Patescibacteria group bacterium]|nr:phosphoribosyltransferase family protein [Patescibacteria group bacterium]
MTFANRAEAGQKLAQALHGFQGVNGIVLAIPRGGVVVGVEIAKALQWPIDVVITRKIGHPLDPEFAIAAVSEKGKAIINEGALNQVDGVWFDEQIDAQREEAKRRRIRYRGEKAMEPLSGKVAMIVDDGTATGLTMRAAIDEVKLLQPEKIVLAIPVAPRHIVEELSHLTDEVIVLSAPDVFKGAIGLYYKEFPQITDEEVVMLLQK